MTIEPDQTGEIYEDASGMRWLVVAVCLEPHQPFFIPENCEPNPAAKRNERRRREAQKRKAA